MAELVIKIPNKDIPKHQEVIDIRLHFIDGHIVDADGYGFMELPKGHGDLIDISKLPVTTTYFGISDKPVEVVKYNCILNAKKIIKADKAESEE